MKQILQSLRTGDTEVADVPCPRAGAGQLLVRTSRTLVSSGTERMLVDFGKAGWIDKARQQPDKVRQVLDKVATDGLVPTVEAVMRKLDQPIALGYCNSGVVEEVGGGVRGFAVGDRVVSNGKHAEMVAVPQNLCARIPDGVTDEQAAFTVLGAIALQGIRLVQPTLGETVVVSGLGLIGLLTVQLLRAHGCKVVGLDFDSSRLALAKRFGAATVDLSSGADPVAVTTALTGGRGVDAVIITASTQSSEPVSQAAQMCRKRGRIVLVGVTGLELSRADFYEKELSFQVSCSYGPGRYDPEYEDKGHDYPLGFVRWTEQRNFEAVLDMLADGRIDVGPLVSHRFPVSEAAAAYELVGGKAPTLGIVLEFAGGEETARRARTVAVNPPRVAPAATGRAPVVGVIGAGNYSGGVLIPAFAEAGTRLKSVASAAGVSGLQAARRQGFEHATTDVEGILRDPEIEAVVIATRHDSHASLIVRALAAGKHVFVEKPLCLTLAELRDIETACAAASDRLLMVGFNRRFAPHVVRTAELLATRPEPKAFVMTVNAGAVSAGHWTLDAAAGGGRIVGEACHFIDLLRHLAGAPITGWTRATLGLATRDSAMLQLSFADGSIGSIQYLANGSRAFPKERLEVFAGGGILQLDNFRMLRGYGWSGFGKQRLWRQDKGQAACAAAFVRAVAAGGPAPIPLEQLLEVSRVTIEAGQG